MFLAVRKRSGNVIDIVKLCLANVFRLFCIPFFLIYVRWYKQLSNRLLFDYNDHTKWGILDTETMKIEGDYELDEIWQKKKAGTLYIVNLADVTVRTNGINSYSYTNDDGDHYVCSIQSVLSSGNVVKLGCGDLWYNNCIWNKSTGCMFKLEIPVSDIIMGRNYYRFEYYNNGAMRDATFYFKGFFHEKSNIDGDKGVKMSEAEFKRKALMGLL